MCNQYLISLTFSVDVKNHVHLLTDVELKGAIVLSVSFWPSLSFVSFLGWSWGGM